MLVAGLTGTLGSGKSTVAHLLAERGAVVLSSDDIGRELMQQGQPVFRQIVAAFGERVLQADGQLNRPELTRLAFDASHPRIEELNAIVHPAVIAEQARKLTGVRQRDSAALVVIESALLLTTRHAGGKDAWRDRFDRIVLVTAPDEVAVARYLQRSSGGRPLSAVEEERLRADAQARLARQRIPREALDGCLVIENAGDLLTLTRRTERVYGLLRAEADRAMRT